MRHAMRNTGSMLVWRMVAATAIVCLLTISAHADWTVVNLNPAGAYSFAYGVYGGQQVGYAVGVDSTSQPTRACGPDLRRRG